MKTRYLVVSALVFLGAACLGLVTYTPVVEVVPGAGLPPEVRCMESNNNLDLVRYKDRLFLAFRTAPYHFASEKTTLYIISSTDQGKTWEFEEEIRIGSDMREPRFLALPDKLMFYFFEAGKNPLAFTPKNIFAMERVGKGDWTGPQKVFKPGCVLWRAKYRNGRAYATVYCGGADMYEGGNKDVGIYFLNTSDGYNFEPVDRQRPVAHTGGSETAFEFDVDGRLYLAVRNEGGDGKTWGSKVCTAGPDDLADWECRVTPMKYDSPLMFRHNDEIYLIARRNPDGAYDKKERWMWDPAETLYYMARYWWTPKRTALYKLDKDSLEMVPVLDFPSRGDTAFPGLVRLSEDEYLMYNYSSHPYGKDRVWMTGQLTGTQIYSTIIKFH